MNHGLRIKDGKATYVSRFVKTSRLKQEEYLGGSKFIKIVATKLKVLDVSYGHGTDNLCYSEIAAHESEKKGGVADCAYWKDNSLCHDSDYNSCVSPSKALALSEGDKPYAIEVFEDGDLLTLGLLDYDKRLGHNFTAHPKVDPFTSSYSEIEVFREALEHMTAILNIVSYKLDMVISRPMQASNTSHYSLFRPSCKGGLSYPLNQELRIWLSEPVLEIVLDNLTSIIRKELGLFLGFDQDLKRLASLLTTIKATLEDAEEKQFTNRAIEDWLLKLKDAAHVLDDILDECATEAMEMEYKGFKCGLSHKVQSFVLSFFLPKHVVFRYKLAKKMKMIRERLDEIAAERIYGRDEDKDKIIDFLVGEASQLDDLSVYRIVGLESVTKKGCEDLDLEPLQRRLQDQLRRKKYLLVLDDVWNEKQEKWRELKSLLACGGKGASIMVTTCPSKV
ncbi:putative disease resistance protein RGA3 [Trifolium repens]|nr:putative disease resistance protein RGA3 [Trifolium repens]